MKKLLLLALLAAPAWAQTNSVYLATPGTGYYTVSGATNVTPIVLTLDTTTGLTTGDIACVVDVNGNSAANSHVKVAGETKHLARKITVLTGTTVSLQDLTNADVAGSGTYVAYSGNPGRLRKCTAYAVHNQYGLYLDGSGGTFYNAMLDTSTTGRKHANNPAYAEMPSFTDIYKGGTWKWGWARKYNASTTPGAGDEPFSLTILGALKHFLTTDTGARDRAIADLNAPDQIGGTVACNLDPDGACGTPLSGHADYQRQLVGYQAVAFDLVKGSMTSQQKLDLFEFWFRDLCWSEGGIDYTAVCAAGTPWTKPVWKIGYSGTADDLTKGTVAWSAGSATITGTGTNFVVDGAAVGDIIYVPHPSENSYAEPCKINARTASSITCEGTLNTSGMGLHYAVGPGWNPAGNDLGQEWQSKHYGVQSFCGNCTNYNGSTAPDFQNNLTIAGMIGQIQKGLAACAEGNQKGCLVVTRQGEQFVDLTMRPLWVINSNGFNGDNPGYNNWRMNAAGAEIIAMFKNGLIGGPDYSAAATNYLPGIVRNAYHGWIAGLDRYLPWAEPNVFTVDASQVRAAMAARYSLASSSTPAKEYQYFINTLHSYNSGFVRDSAQKGQYLWWLYFFNDPVITPSAPQLTALGSNDNATCVSWFGTAKCEPSSTAQMNTVAEWGGFWSRSAWTAAATYVAGYFHAWAQLGHSSSAPPGQVHIYKNSKCLVCGDDTGFYGGFQAAGAKQGSMPIPGGDSGVNNIPTVAQPVTNPWGLANDNFGFIRSVLTTIFKTPITLVERQVLDFKGKGILIHDYQTASSSTSLGAYVHLGLNGCGTPTSSSCLSINTGAMTFGNLQTASGLLAKVFGLGGTTVAISTENGGTDFSYADSLSKTGRVKVARSTNGTSFESVMVMQTNANAGGETMCNGGDIVITVVSNHTIVECKDSSTPFVGAFPRGGASSASLTFSTTFSGTGRYGVTGLDAATYNVTEDGSPVSGSPFTVTAAARALTFDAGSGSIVITQGTPPPSIDQTSLPGGTVGVSYSQTLTATGGAGSNVWTCPGCTFPPGLLMTTGVISGTPTTAGTYPVTIIVTDADLGTDTLGPTDIVIAAAPGGGAGGTRFSGGVRCNGCRIP